MKILIIGGTGLISTAITRMLVARGNQVTLYNRGIRRADIPNNVRRIIGDRTEFAVFESQMAEAGWFDCAIDMVCYRPEEVESAIRAFKGRLGQYIFCSTVDVYTKPASRYPIREQEERQPSATFSYAFNKAACENILLSAHQRGDFAPITIIRPAHTYGEGGGLIHSLGWQTYYLDRIRKGRPIIVHGDGSSLWATCHRDDVGRAFVEAVGNAATFGQAYHVTGEEWMPWDRYHQGVAEAMDAPAPDLVHIPTDLLSKVVPERAKWCVENFQFNNIFDNTAACTDLDFRYTIPWVEGARRTIQALEAHAGIENSDDYPFYDRIVDAWKNLGTEMTRALVNSET
jgi:nucleoside-diphosphate-sugar epimerase